MGLQVETRRWGRTLTIEDGAVNAASVGIDAGSSVLLTGVSLIAHGGDVQWNPPRFHLFNTGLPSIDWLDALVGVKYKVLTIR